ncbi:hypothetical protein BJ944DRAFT_66970 [Cunninghamella echinulata]|nr:hypothetical protein BJ944DRAFT_66970 [Cunninghamella echinulata]
MYLKEIILAFLLALAYVNAQMGTAINSGEYFILPGEKCSFIIADPNNTTYSSQDWDIKLNDGLATFKSYNKKKYATVDNYDNVVYKADPYSFQVVAAANGNGEHIVDPKSKKVWTVVPGAAAKEKGKVKLTAKKANDPHQVFTFARVA